jgi:hypothetical protein
MAMLKILGLFFGESHRRTRVASQPRAKRLSPGFSPARSALAGRDSRPH